MKELFLSEIIAATGAAVSNYFKDTAVTGISSDTRNIKSGDLFFALKGETYDGHDFIGVAISKGASAIVSSRGADIDIPVLTVRDTVVAYQALAAYYRLKFDIPVIAVTGSAGKTTVKNMTASVLSAKFRVFCSDRNYNNEIGLPQSIFELDDSYDAAVFELAMNHSGEIAALSKIAKPDIAIITNIGKAHIGNLGSRQNILESKLEILEGLKKDGLLILNADDDLLREVKPEIHKTVFVGGKENGLTIRASGIRAETNPITFDINYGEKSYKCEIPAIGAHNVTNALLAVRCGLHLGIRPEEAVKELKRFAAPPMRAEISYLKGITIIKDYYNSSPESARAGIKILSGYNPAVKKIAILGEMSELGDFSAEEHLSLAKLCFDKKIDYVFFIGSDFKSFRKGFSGACECFDAHERDALKSALKSYVNRGLMSEGAAVLIKGSRNMRMEEFYDSLKRYINAAKGDFNDLPHSAAKLYVDVGAIKYNYSQIKNAVGSGVEILPMVKANAYGCGNEIIANVFRDSKYLAVADIKEAALIRRILPDAGIVIIYQPYSDDIERIVSDGFAVAVSRLDFAKKLDAEAGKNSKKIRIHIEVDTGAGRLGLEPRDCLNFAEEIKGLENLIAEGVFMHYSCADSYSDSDLEFTKQQTALFKKAVSDIESVLGNIPYIHACSGAAVFNPNAERFNMIRPGYMLYGYYPCEALKEKVLLKPALKFTSVITHIKELEKDMPISYNRAFNTKRKSRIATVSAGYSDGINRKLFNKDGALSGCFVVNGQRAPITGTVCMDLTMIDITDIKGEVRVGDEAAIFDNSNVTVEEIAEICGTIGYEVISQIEDKADRVEVF